MVNETIWIGGPLGGEDGIDYRVGSRYREVIVGYLEV